MKVSHYQNEEVEVYDFDLSTGEDVTLTPELCEVQQAFWEENGWAYGYGLTAFLKGEVSISSIVLVDPVIVRSGGGVWNIGTDRITGNPFKYTALNDVKFICLTYRDHHVPDNFAKAILADSDEYVFEAPGWAYVAEGTVTCNDVDFPTHSLLKIENPGSKCRARGDTVLTMLGL